jgi:hypothetical protein
VEPTAIDIDVTLIASGLDGAGQQFAYAHARGTANFGSSGLPAEIPFVVEGLG